MVAHPTELARRYSDYQRMGRNISVDHAAGPDEGILADRYAAVDGTVRVDRRAALHQRRTVFVLARERRARIVEVVQHHAGTEKHIYRKSVVHVKSVSALIPLVGHHHI